MNQQAWLACSNSKQPNNDINGFNKNFKKTTNAKDSNDGIIKHYIKLA
jgi:hypothetical protein